MVAVLSAQGLNPQAPSFAPALVRSKCKLPVESDEVIKPRKKSWADIVKSKSVSMEELDMQVMVDNSLNNTLPISVEAACDTAVISMQDDPSLLDVPPGLDISVGSTMPPGLGVSHSVGAMVFADAECAPPPGLELSHDGVDPTMALHAALLAERQALLWRFQQQLTQNISPPGVWSMPPPWSAWNSWPAAAAESHDDKSDQLSDVSTDIVSSTCDAESSAASVVDVGE